MVAIMADGRVGLDNVHKGVGVAVIKGNADGTWILSWEFMLKEFVVVKFKVKLIGEETVRKVDWTVTEVKILATGVIANVPKAILLFDLLIPSETLLDTVSTKHLTMTPETLNRVLILI